jgi:hypothetical protein
MPYTTTNYCLFVDTQGLAPVLMLPPICSFDQSKGEYVYPTSTLTSGAAPTCNGQVVDPPTRNPGCIALADQYGVSTGDLKVAAGNDLSRFSSAICLPLPCETRAMAQYGESCSLVSRKIGLGCYKEKTGRSMRMASRVEWRYGRRLIRKNTGRSM